MRIAFIETLCELAAQDDRIWLVTGDLGFSVLERFAERFPDRYVNAGVAEQNMTGMAAGLALSGKIVFTYSIVNFAVMRCLEQIRNDVCYHGLNVNVVAVGGGVAYGGAGYTHHGLEDVAVMRTLPGMTVVAPGDPAETRLATRAIAELDGPCYLRLGKSREPEVHESDPDFTLGRAIIMRDGRDATLISSGAMLTTAVEAARLLADEGIGVRLLSMHTVKPLDAEAIREALRETGAVFTVEEHGKIGGLGSAVAEVVAEAGVAEGRFTRLAIRDDTFHHIGSQTFLCARSGLTPQAIAETVRAALAGASGVGRETAS